MSAIDKPTLAPSSSAGTTQPRRALSPDEDAGVVPRRSGHSLLRAEPPPGQRGRQLARHLRRELAARRPRAGGVLPRVSHSRHSVADHAQNAGFRRVELPSLAGLVEIIYLSWFANSVVPAKLGDVYRAYLVRERSTTRISFSKAGGTIVAERLLDLAVLLVLLGATGLLSFRGAVPGPILAAIEIGSLLLLAAGVGVLFLRQMSGLVRRFVPPRFVRIYDNFVAGAVDSFGRYPQLLGLTLLAWLAELGRLFLVTQALGVHLSPNPLVEATMIVFIALGAAFLTAPPGTPAGLGYVEASIALALTMIGLNQSVALSVALLDRAISFGSLVVGGLVVYLLSARRVS